jgi:hypothetical protein
MFKGACKLTDEGRIRELKLHDSSGNAKPLYDGYVAGEGASETCLNPLKKRAEISV